MIVKTVETDPDHWCMNRSDPMPNNQTTEMTNNPMFINSTSAAPSFNVEMVPGGFLPPDERGPYAAAHRLRLLGHQVAEQKIPGLWRINGGPEVTGKELMHLVGEEAGQHGQ
jgi:hypothetical protein